MSTTEWMPSLIIAELPVMAPAMNLITAIARLPMIAATTAFLDSAAMGAVYCTRDRVPGHSPDLQTGTNRV